MWRAALKKGTVISRTGSSSIKKGVHSFIPDTLRLSEPGGSCTGASVHWMKNIFEKDRFTYGDHDDDHHSANIFQGFYERRINAIPSNLWQLSINKLRVGITEHFKTSPWDDNGAFRALLDAAGFSLLPPELEVFPVNLSDRLTASPRKFNYTFLATEDHFVAICLKYLHFFDYNLGVVRFYSTSDLIEFLKLFIPSVYCQESFWIDLFPVFYRYRLEI